MSIAIEDLKLERLSVQERLELIEAIWNSLPTQLAPEDIPLEFMPELERRYDEATANPGVGKPWREVLESL